jgi:hypothetical protein
MRHTPQEKAELKRQLRNDILAYHIEGVDMLVNEITKDNPELSRETLVVRFVPEVEKMADICADEFIKFKEKIQAIAAEEIYKHTNTALAATTIL